MANGVPKWVRITMKFTGTCVACSKPIQTGQQGMWARDAGVKHLECAGIEDSGGSGNLAAGRSITCAVCGRPAGCAECEFQDMCDIPSVSPNCLCNECSRKDDVIPLYQKSVGGRFPALARPD